MARSSDKGVAQVSAPTAIPYRKSPWLEERDRKVIESAVLKARRETRRETRSETALEHVKVMVAFRLGRELTKAEQRFLSVQLRSKDFTPQIDMICDVSQAELLKWFDSAP